jgi:hypothetical protein
LAGNRRALRHRKWHPAPSLKSAHTKNYSKVYHHATLEVQP